MQIFGKTSNEHIVHAADLSAHGLSVTILTRGAVLQDLRLEGCDYSLTIGLPTVAHYEGAYDYFGAVVGPVANRLRGAQARIHGVLRGFDANENGKTTLHGGSRGLHSRIWNVTGHGSNHLTLSIDLPDGTDGFPGNRTVTAAFTISEGPALTLTLTTTTDAPTIANCTSHAYWNLDGSGTTKGHTLRIAADHYLPVDADILPTGEIAPVAGTDFDFTEARAVIPAQPPLDHNFCTASAQQPLRDVLWLSGAKGVHMTVATTEPGLQIYDHRSPALPDGKTYAALAIEAQGWPDAPNMPHFPSIEIASDRPAVQTTRWLFSRPA